MRLKKCPPTKLLVALCAAAGSAVLWPMPVIAQVVPTEEAAESGMPAASYSPYANRSFPTKLLWSETHLHTALSLDAGAFGNIRRRGRGRIDRLAVSGRA